MIVYLDESGCLGWRFDAPYRRGGSSRFITIAHLIIPKAKTHIPKRLVRDIYQRKGWSPKEELKASNLKPGDREFVAVKVADMLASHEDIKVVAITARKENVQEHIRRDGNKLYNYMIKLCLLGHIQGFPSVDFVPDNRSVKVKSGNSLCDYLQTALWLEMDSPCQLNNMPQESHKNLNLQLADFLANIVWRNFEFKDKAAFSIISPSIHHQSLFFWSRQAPASR